MAAPMVIEIGTGSLNLLIMVFIFVILSQSWNIIGGYTGQINLGLAAFFGCGVLVTHFVWKAEMPIYLAVIAGGLSAVVLAGIIGLPTLRLKGAYFAIGTFALAEVCRIVVGNIFERMIEMPGSYAASYSLIPRYYLGLTVAFAAIAVTYFITRSKLGLGMVAVRDSEQAAQVTGVNSFKYKVYALLISAFLAGLGGGVYAFMRLSFHYVTAVFSPIWTFEPLMAAVIGGSGTLIGPVIGSIFLVVLSEIFALTLGEAHLIIFGLLFILVVMYFPYGLVGSVSRIRQIISRVGRGLCETGENCRKGF
ncbi:MAG: branched-chain amino acid ABC transporter permease [Deltaproteobacteria bacterium]|nr:branched-chain amino acid ABC transporter permease [Deltaproteobacteria bacterium]MBW2043786.1 branched-chain amino acid ABC transporter permease [Deltaproteobacteria bacterium]